MIFVIDASAAAEVLFGTPLGERALETIGDEIVVAPELIDAEVLSFIRRKVLQGVVSPRRAGEAIGMMVAWPFTRLSHRPLLTAAFALRENLSAYDALYAAAAVAVSGEIVTADGPLARAPIDLVIHNVRE
ncbi:MAG TPA: type II toxin-antitoxin system VapC family toxin [Actinomycetota bacterium]|nr:type II toxin-antitoxin system VapC family toxin [Actinomycetota bacterium]